MRIGVFELGIIFAIVILIVGPTQLPKLTEAFKKSKKMIDDEKKNERENDI